MSLTSTSRRLQRLPRVLESLLAQDAPPARVVLWLSEEPWLLDKGIQPNALPPQIHALQDRGLTIRWTRNTGPYRKLLPALREYGGAVATADDDTLYPPDWLTGLLAMQAQTPGAVCCYRARRMMFRDDGRPLSLWFWPRYEDAQLSQNCFPIGKDGILYPAGALHPRVLDEALALHLAPTCDDIWFKTMALLCGTPARSVPNHLGFPMIKLSAAVGLYTGYNLLGNDVAIDRVGRYFGVFGLPRTDTQAAPISKTSGRLGSPDP